jgi:dethiobiotin synthetase
VAAEAEGRSIDLLRIEEIVARASAPIVVEAAGGLLVPLAWESPLEQVDPADRAPPRSMVTNLDLADRLGLPVLLVGRAGLGTLNHCALSVEAIERRGLQLTAVLLNRTSEHDDPSVESNPRWVSELTGARVLGPTPFVADSSARPRLLAPFVDSMVPRR